MRWSWIAMMLGVATLAACGGGQDHAERPQPPAVTAVVMHAQRVEVPQTIEVYGTVEANRQAAVSSRVMATVREVRVSAGETVRPGQLLVVIDPETAQGQEAQARGALAQAQAAVSLAERNYQRYKALHEKNAASDLELDMARMQYEQARGALEQGQGALGAASSVAAESRVVAPFAGRVVAKMVEVGDLAAPGRPLVMIESATGRRLTLAVPESLVADADMRIGMKLSVRIDRLGDRVLEGTVVEMSPGADPATHTFAVKVDVSGEEIPSGVAGRAAIAVGNRTAVVIPEQAVLRSGGLTLVAVRDDEGRARTRVVTLGARLPDGRVEVLSGLTGGEPVLVGLNAPPLDGAPVEEARS